jgi:hypothetical protein
MYGSRTLSTLASLGAHPPEPTTITSCSLENETPAADSTDALFALVVEIVRSWLPERLSDLEHCELRDSIKSTRNASQGIPSQ